MISANDATNKILFVCNDVIGSGMAGPGIRYWEMAQALKRKGHEVVILARHIESVFSGKDIAFIGQTTFLNLITWTWRADCVIQPGRPVSILLALLFHKKLIFDQYDPVIFEFLERKLISLSGKIQRRLMLFLWKIRQRIILRFGDSFLVANEKQKDFLIGQMTILGYTNKHDSITVLPFGLPDTRPVKNHPVLRGTKIKETDFLLVWGGGIWDWFDPFTLLRAFAKVQSQRNDIKVYFPGLRPPSPDSQTMTVVEKFLSEAKRLGLLENTVFVNMEWTPYEQRADYLLEADAGISLHQDTLEARFAFRTRMLDYLWAGLPIIASQGDSWGDLIEQKGLGITVPCGDVKTLIQEIIRMADDTQFRNHCARNVKNIAPEYSWEVLAESLHI